MKPSHIPDWILIFIFFLSFYLLTFGRAQEYSYNDGTLMFNVTKSIVEDGSLSSRVPGYYRGGVFIEHSQYGLGFSIFTIPFYSIAKVIAPWIDPFKIDTITRFSPMFANMVITALTCSILFLFSYRLFRNKFTAFITTAIYGFATIAWPYSRYDFSEPLTGLCILFSIYTLYLFQDSLQKYWLVLSSITISYAIFTRFVEVISLPVWFLLLYLILKQKRITLNIALLIRVFLPLLLILILYFWYNFYRYGNCFTTGYNLDLRIQTLVHNLGIGLYGLLLSPGKGIFWYNPPMLLSLFAFPIFWKQNRTLCYGALGIVLLHILAYSTWLAWEGGWCWGPRFLLPIIPWLSLALGYLFGKRNWILAVAAILFIYGITVQFLGIVFPFNIYIYSMVDQGITFHDLLFQVKDSPIFGDYYLLIGLPFERWDFALVPLISGVYKYPTIITASVLFFLFIASAIILIKRIKRIKQTI